MTSRAFGIVLAVVIGTPLFAAAVLALCSPVVAVIVCLAVAGAGMIGTCAGIALLSPAAPKGQGPAAKELDPETNDAICDAVERLSERGAL